jgi:hypothetical protein
VFRLDTERGSSAASSDQTTFLCPKVFGVIHFPKIFPNAPLIRSSNTSPYQSFPRPDLSLMAGYSSLGFSPQLHTPPLPETHVRVGTGSNTSLTAFAALQTSDFVAHGRAGIEPTRPPYQDGKLPLHHKGIVEIKVKSAESSEFLHFQLSAQHSALFESAQWESNPHVRHGKAIGYRYIMGALTNQSIRRGSHPRNHFGRVACCCYTTDAHEQWKRWESNPRTPA